MSDIVKGFASDNHSGAHPEVLEAIRRANVGHARAYGGDPWTRRLDDVFRRHFGPDAVGFPVFNGTAANVLAIDALTRPFEGVICADRAHIQVDECGAPQRFAGVTLLLADSIDGKLRPEQLGGWEPRRGDQHHVQPALVSVAQATEAGTVYSAAELAALAERAHSLGMLLHLDGARLANAAAALGVGLGELTSAAGVDVVSLGATKNGGLVGDAVVFLRPGDAQRFEYVRKQGMQLASKMRLVSCQLEALLGGDLWRRNAQHANAMAARLARAVAEIDGVELAHPVEANSVFARLPRPAIDQLLAGSPDPFHVWDDAADEVRWMCSWDTTEQDIDDFAAAVAEAVREVR